MALIWMSTRDVIPGYGLCFRVRARRRRAALSGLANDSWDRCGQIARRM
jgi:hypothetical protein